MKIQQLSLLKSLTSITNFCTEFSRRGSHQRRSLSSILNLFILSSTISLLGTITSQSARALTPSGVTVTRITPFAPLDSNNSCNAGPRAMYIQVNVQNTSGGTLTGLSANLNSFSNSAFTLDAGESPVRYIGTLAAGQTTSLYWYVNYPCVAGNVGNNPPATNYTVTLSDSTAGTATSSLLTLTTRSEISASAGGDVFSALVGAGAVAGQILQYTVRYNFGNPGNNADAVIQPAGNVEFDSGCFRLIGVNITSSTFTAGPTINSNRLYFTGVSGSSSNSATVVYSFIALCTGTSTTAKPYADLEAGGVKYTGNYATAVGGSFPVATNPFTITKTASPATLPTGGTVTYTVTITNTSIYNSVLDRITDTLPPGVTYGALVTGTSTTITTGSSSQPTAGATGTINWIGTPYTSYTVPANSSIILKYTAIVPNTPGAYTNSVTATAGSSTTPPATSSVGVGSADVVTTKTGPATVVAGSTVTYNLTTVNNGPNPATNVIITDNIGTGRTGVVATNSGTYNSTTGIVTFPTITTLANGATQANTISFTAPASGSITDTVSSTSNTSDLTPANNDGTATAANVTTTITQAPDLTITKTHTGNFTQGQTGATYTLTATNSGLGATASNVTITDALPTGLVPTAATGTDWICTITGQDVSCTRTTFTALAAGSSYPVITITANVANSAPSSVINTANISGGGETNTGNNSASDTTTILPTADIALTKTHTGNFTVGQNGTYTLSVTNNGLSTAAGSLTVTDTLPTGLSFVSGTGTNWSCSASGQTVTCTNPNPLASGATSTISLTVAVSSQAASTVTNTASASSTTNDSTPGNNTASDPTIVRASADLSLTKTTSNSTPNVNDSITYTVTLTNSGLSTATNVQVRDQIPAGITFGSATTSAGTIYNSGTGLWSVPSLASGTSVTLQLTGTVNVGSVITNTAEVNASDQFDPDSTPNNNIATEDDQASVTITPRVADLSITKTDSPDPVIAGANLTYAIAVTNNGSATATNATMSDPLPSGTTFQSITTPPGWTCITPAVGSNGIVSCTNASFAVGSANFTLVVRVAPNAANNSSLSNTASVSSTTSDPNASNNSSSQTTTVQQSADLRLTKVATPASPAVGGTFDYTIIVTNDGSSTASNVQVRDALPSGIAYNSNTPSQGTYDPISTQVWSVGTLNPGASATLVINATRSNASVTVNTAEIIAADQSDPDSPHNNQVAGEDDQDSVTVPNQSVDLAVAKTVNNPTPNIGSNVTFTITVTNPTVSITAATNVGLSDILPQGLTYQSNTVSTGTYNSGSGVWSIASLNPGDTASLTITATVTTFGAKTNTAQLGNLDQTDPNSNNNSSSATVTPASIPPNLLLVKRITAINGVDVTGFQDGVNTPGDPNNVGTKAAEDNNSLWPVPNTTSLRGAIHSSTIAPGVSFKPGDEVEYTIYFLNNGASQADNVSICDFVPANQTYIGTGYTSLATADVGGLAGSNYGIAILSANGGTPVKATNAVDGDRGQFYSSSFPSSCTGTTNGNGAVVVNMGSIPNATGSGTPANSYGFIRFKAKIN